MDKEHITDPRYPGWAKNPMAWYCHESPYHQMIAQHMILRKQDPDQGDWVAFCSKVLPLSWEIHKACKQFCEDVISGKKELPTE